MMGGCKGRDKDARGRNWKHAGCTRPQLPHQGAGSNYVAGSSLTCRGPVTTGCTSVSLPPTLPATRGAGCGTPKLEPWRRSRLASTAPGAAPVAGTPALCPAPPPARCTSPAVPPSTAPVHARPCAAAPQLLWTRCGSCACCRRCRCRRCRACCRLDPGAQWRWAARARAGAAHSAAGPAAPLAPASLGPAAARPCSCPPPPQPPGPRGWRRGRSGCRHTPTHPCCRSSSQTGPGWRRRRAGTAGRAGAGHARTALGRRSPARPARSAPGWLQSCRSAAVAAAHAQAPTAAPVAARCGSGRGVGAGAGGSGGWGHEACCCCCCWHGLLLAPGGAGGHTARRCRAAALQQWPQHPRGPPPHPPRRCRCRCRPCGACAWRPAPHPARQRRAPAPCTHPAAARCRGRRGSARTAAPPSAAPATGACTGAECSTGERCNPQAPRTWAAALACPAPPPVAVHSPLNIVAGSGGGLVGKQPCGTRTHLVVLRPVARQHLYRHLLAAPCGGVHAPKAAHACVRAHACMRGHCVI